MHTSVLFRAEIPGFAGIIPAEFRAFFLPPKFTGIGKIPWPENIDHKGPKGLIP